MKKFRHLLEYSLVLTFGALIRAVPLGAALRTGVILGDIAFGIIRMRRKVVLRNLRLAFPEKSESELVRIARDVYRHAGMSFVEMLRLPLSGRDGISGRVEFEGLEHLDELVSSGRGAVMVGAHFGSWELMGAALCRKGYPLDVLAFRQHNEFFNKMLDSYRYSAGIGLIRLELALRTGLKALKRGRFVAFLADQDAGRRDGMFVDFFGRPASTNKGPAVFALKTGAAVIAGFCVRQQSSEKHRVIFVPVKYEQSGDYETDVGRITAECSRLIERYVREYPSEWFWFHKRWKTTPDGMKNFYS
jgi:KDO2-lipid IV(A) lauroyltransferase